MTFDYIIVDTRNNKNPKFGFSINYGNATLGTLGSGESGMLNQNDVTKNLSFQINLYESSDELYTPQIKIVHKDHTNIETLDTIEGDIIKDGQYKQGSIYIHWDPTNGASFYSHGLITNADFEDISTKTFTGNDDYTFIITSRMGQTYEILMIDNIRIDHTTNYL